MPIKKNPNYKQTEQKMTNHARNALFKAGQFASGLKYREINCSHLLLAIYLEKGSLGSNILSDIGINQNNFNLLWEDKFDGFPNINNLISEKENSDVLPFSPELKKIIVKAHSVARDFNYSYVGTEHLVYALLASEDDEIKKIITKPEIKTLEKSVRSLMDPGQFSNFSKIFNLLEIKLGKSASQKSSAMPHIIKFCSDVNEEVKIKGETIVGREKELERIINILGRKNKNNPILIGEAGVGKTVLVEKLAQFINSGNVPPHLYKKKIMSLDIAQLIAGTSFRGEFESRLNEIVKEAKNNGNIILFIDELHNIIGAGNVSGSLDLANIIKPPLARGDLQVIGATTSREYKKYLEKDSALDRRFQPIFISEPSQKETEEILFGIRKNYETFHNVRIPDESIILAVDLSIRYIQKRFLPDKAIDVLDEASAYIRSKNKVSDFLKEIKKIEEQKKEFLEKKENLVQEENYEEAIKLKSQENELDKNLKIIEQKQAEAEKSLSISIMPEDIIETVSKISGIPKEKLSPGKSAKIKKIKKILNERIIGQEEVIEKLSSALLRSQSGISNPNRPLGSFLFLGPTGVGKTLTAKILSQEFFSTEKSLIKIDMSELMERHSIASLIGSPAGYIGYGEGGNLTEKIRHNPYSIVLFDEIEKAHPDVFNILLQILEDGILTDAEGMAVSFKNSIIILTSNIGTGEFTNASQIGFDKEKSNTKKSELIGKRFNEIRNQTIKELEKTMKPELLNRLDYILVFKALGLKEIEKISAIELKKLKQHLAKQQIVLCFDQAVIKFISQKSLAFNQGARLVRKNIQDLVENKIAEMIVNGKINNHKLTIAAAKEKLNFF